MDSREVRVPRMLGVFAAGKIMNPKLARSQLIGSMTWGMSMALHEESVLDREFGDYLNHDLAQYHIPGQRGRPQHRRALDRRGGSEHRPCREGPPAPQRLRCLG